MMSCRLHVGSGVTIIYFGEWLSFILRTLFMISVGLFGLYKLIHFSVILTTLILILGYAMNIFLFFMQTCIMILCFTKILFCYMLPHIAISYEIG